MALDEISGSEIAIRNLDHLTKCKTVGRSQQSLLWTIIFLIDNTKWIVILKLETT